jgi:hypothetical protein
MLLAPGSDLRAIEGTVVVRVHLIEASAGPLPSPLLRALEVLLARDPARPRRRCSGRRRSLEGSGLGFGLGKNHRGEQRYSDEGGHYGCTHFYHFQLI